MTDPRTSLWVDGASIPLTTPAYGDCRVYAGEDGASLIRVNQGRNPTKKDVLLATIEARRMAAMLGDPWVAALTIEHTGDVTPIARRTLPRSNPSFAAYPHELLVAGIPIPNKAGYAEWVVRDKTSIPRVVGRSSRSPRDAVHDYARRLRLRAHAILDEAHEIENSIRPTSTLPKIDLPEDG